MTGTRAEDRGPVAVVVMGVAGSGKSTVGAALADRLGWDFVDADDHHPAANVDKMRRGEPLDDRDRSPWLDALRTVIDDHARRGAALVMACSALRRSYRDRLGVDGDRVRLVHLDVGRHELERRLRERTGHFMAVDMLDSQLATLEPPDPAGAMVVDGGRDTDSVVTAIVSALVR